MESNSSKKSQPSGNKPRVNNDEICQNCQYHKNKPSWCNYQAKFTARKFTCDDFKRSKK